MNKATRCPKCNKKIRYKKVKGKKIPVSIGTIFVIPGEHNSQNTFVATYGAFIKGQISDDGIMCHIIHKCN